MALPDFFVIGAPKAGTTALHAALGRHPQLFMSAGQGAQVLPLRRAAPRPRRSRRRPQLPGVDLAARATTSASSTAPRPAPCGARARPSTCPTCAAHRRIHRAVPDARLIVILRDPVDRAYSNWAHLWADGLETIGDFVTACAEEPAADRGRVGARSGATWRTGLYGRQLRHLFGLFPRHQVLVIRYLALVDQPGDHPRRRSAASSASTRGWSPRPRPGTWAATCPPRGTPRCCGPPSAMGPTSGSHFPPQVWRKASLPLQWLIQRTPQHRPELAEADRAQLISYFDDDITIVEEETGLGPRRLAHLPGGRDVLGAQVVGPVAPAGLVVEAGAPVGQRHHRHVAQRTPAVGPAPTDGPASAASDPGVSPTAKPVRSSAFSSLSARPS